MPCDTVLKPRQTQAERNEEIRKAVQATVKGLVSGRVKAKVGPQGAIAFDGIAAEERNGASDACIYRKVMASGSVTAKLAIMRAEQLAGRSVDLKVVSSGVHSHDGGATWHGKD